MKAKSFNDLIFWEKARQLTIIIYSYTQNGSFKKDYGLKDQIQRACVSVMSNIAEGFGRGSNKEFIQFLFIAKGSLAEIQSQLYLTKDLKYISDSEFKHAFNMTEEISRLISSFIKRLKGNYKQGLKTF